MFSKVYNGKRVLVTGNSGFKGSWLTAWLLKLGAQVIGVSKDIPTKPAMFEELRLAERIIHFQEDVRDLKSLSKIIIEYKPEFIFHLAAQALVTKSYLLPLETLETNIIGTANLLEALRVTQYNCNAIIITSDKCYDNVESIWGYKETDSLGGKDIYSGSKGAAELVVKSYFHSFFNGADSSVRVATARAGNVIGGGDWADKRVVPDCIKSWIKNKKVQLRNPYSIRPWQHVLESLSGYLLLGQRLQEDKSLNGQNFNFGPLAVDTCSVIHIIEELAKYWGFTNLSEAYSINEEEKFYEASVLKLNSEKVHYFLGWSPTYNRKKLLETTIEWYLNFYGGSVDMFNYTLQQIEDYEAIALSNSLSWAVK